jgi:hypothetical protein
MREIMRRALINAIAVVLVAALAAVVLYEVQITNSNGDVSIPLTHTPAYLGNPQYILGSGYVVQNSSAYSYMRINASAINYGDNFTVYPAINVPLFGVNENNLTATIIYRGSSFGSSPYWLNFSVIIPAFHFSANSSQRGIASNFTRSAFPLQNQEVFFSQISNVVNSNNEFEYFFYIGNSSTPSPQLTHGLVH